MQKVYFSLGLRFHPVRSIKPARLDIRLKGINKQVDDDLSADNRADNAWTLLRIYQERFSAISFSCVSLLPSPDENIESKVVLKCCFGLSHKKGISDTLMRL
ncbi:uncharacterized protein SETTUDRAFT_162073 [Exserohilum turcica Et28A]|uniref:Uncharacterized protein n=1 Tax=Exserohilum turcicum (strain 28A) TaxID=671987 RepID=R0J2W7_EXST2|nr:uncharacterized protein SETTUDRAFT_162073 [Exserohilum turcica Et28A]EOA91320.1 hypothetical protein SETTUDRAFT_162073 [Exserohilum turcica Et28A]